MSASLKKLEVKPAPHGRCMVSIPFGLVAVFVERQRFEIESGTGAIILKNCKRERRLLNTLTTVHDAKKVKEKAEVGMMLKHPEMAHEVNYVIADAGIWSVDRMPEEALLYA
jgi:hypothetical protein